MNARILVVEDNAALAENVAELLREDGAEVLIADGARAAEKSAREHGFDLAIVDIGLAGGVSGLDLVPELRAYSADGEIILMTGDATLDTAIQAIRRGVYAYITKPFEPEQLSTLSKRALAQVALKREKRLLAQRLEASEALYRGVVESVEACILGLDRDGVIRFTNRFAAERVGRTPGELVGKSFTSLCEPRDVHEVTFAIERATRGQAVRDQDCRLATPSGKPRTVRFTLTPLARPERDKARANALDTGTEPVVLAAGIDITDRLALEQKTAEAEAMAAMGALTTGLAHEIRNPLNAAKLQLELLMRRAKRISVPDAQTSLVEPAELVKSEIHRLSEMLDEFLDLARPRPLLRRELSIRELFDNVLQLEQPVARVLGASLSAHVEPPELKVRADRDKLIQVLINLVSNAVDAVRDVGGGQVTLRALPAEDGGVVICVEDNGAGVPEAVAQSAFKPFVTSKPAGTGLGLAIVQKIVAQHGGTAELVPRPGGGTIARFYVPA